MNSVDIDWIPHPLDDWLVWTVGLGIIGYALKRAWEYAIFPFFNGAKGFITALVGLAKALDTLHDIALQFETNGGTSLIDRVTALQSGLDNLSQQMEQHILFFGEYVSPFLQSLDPSIPDHPELADC